MTRRLGLLARGIIAILVAVLAVACTGGAPTPPPSDGTADLTTLIPSNWEVTWVKGTAIAAKALPILVIGRSNSARLELGCGELDLSYPSASNGSELSFEEVHWAAACDSPADPVDLAVRAAVGMTEAWRSVTDSTIELLDGGGLVLVSLRMTTCDCPHQPPGSRAPTSS